MNDFRRDVIEGLSSQTKYIPSKYFYDAIGSDLFEQITRLPEYYPTRTEIQIMKDHAADVAEQIGPKATIVEYGSGSGLKTQLLLKHANSPQRYAAVEISESSLQASIAALRERFPGIEFHPVLADYTREFTLPFTKDARKVVYFPGSTIGNFKPGPAMEFLKLIRSQVGDEGGLLIGVDLKKDPAVLHAAYNDAQDITAEFNLNLLDRMNRELGADFVRADFDHYAFYNPYEGRIEMHLVSREYQTVNVGSDSFDFIPGEPIVTEYSYKYSPKQFQDLASSAGFFSESLWMDKNRFFGLFYLSTN